MPSSATKHHFSLGALFALVACFESASGLSTVPVSSEMNEQTKEYQPECGYNPAGDNDRIEHFLCLKTFAPSRTRMMARASNERRRQLRPPLSCLSSLMLRIAVRALSFFPARYAPSYRVLRLTCTSWPPEAALLVARTPPRHCAAVPSCANVQGKRPCGFGTNWVNLSRFSLRPLQKQTAPARAR